MKRKLFSSALALALCLGLTAPALAVGKAGDTTMQDDFGHTFTLSKPILYTVPKADFAKLKIEEGASLLLEDFEVAYAVPAGTVLTAPSGVQIESMDCAEIAKQGSSYSLTVTGGGGHPWSGYEMSDPNTLWVFPLGARNGDALDMHDEDNDGGGSTIGSDYFVYGRIAFLTTNESTHPEWVQSSNAKPDNAGNTYFTDVPANAYYAKPVAWTVKKEITSGTSTATFSPNETCTTAQILTFLWRAKGSPETTIKNPFSDVADNNYYTKAALWAYEKGLVSGSAFGANDPCTRSMTVTYLWKLAGKPTAAASSFTDVPGSADYAKAVDWAVSKGITSGTSNNTFSPNTTCTRGQIVTFLYRDFA